MVDKLGAGGLDDWEVKIADFVVLLGKDAKKVPDAANRAKGLWEIRLRCRKRGLTPMALSCVSHWIIRSYGLYVFSTTRLGWSSQYVRGVPILAHSDSGNS